MEFVGFPKIHRFSREVIITEKIDGTHAQIYIGEGGEKFLVGSRTQWITPEKDNHGFAKWAYEHKEELMQLGPGHHFGEWWGQGIQRNYGLKEKRFSLFNVKRWSDDLIRPACCYVVPVIIRGILGEIDIYNILHNLSVFGSYAAPGFMRPEGIVIYHVASNVAFKKTIEKDDEPKSQGETNVK